MIVVSRRVVGEARISCRSDCLDTAVVITQLAYAIYDADPVEFRCLMSRSCTWSGLLRSAASWKRDFRYSNTLGWNTFPVPTLTDKNKADLTRCAEDILLAREAHFPATIADLYDPETMPADLRAAHERNDEVWSASTSAAASSNDTERLEKLFELYTKMAGASQSTACDRAAKVRGTSLGRRRREWPQMSRGTYDQEC